MSGAVHVQAPPCDYAAAVTAPDAIELSHQERLAGRNGDTVTEIAARWGFAHTGGFAVLYRRTYGQRRHITLNNN